MMAFCVLNCLLNLFNNEEQDESVLWRHQQYSPTLCFMSIFLKGAFIISLKNSWPTWPIWKGLRYKFLPPHMHPHTTEMSFHTMVSIFGHLQFTSGKYQVLWFSVQIWNIETLKQLTWCLLCQCSQGDHWTPFPRGIMGMCSHAFAMTMLRNVRCYTMLGWWIHPWR